MFGNGSVSEKDRIRFGMSLVRFGLKNTIQFICCSYLVVVTTQLVLSQSKNFLS